MCRARILWLASLLTFTSCTTSQEGTSFQIPGGQSGIGFDDLRYSIRLHRVLVPAGRTGSLALINPDSGDIAEVAGFSSSHSYDGGHDFGVTSVDEGNGYLFATDRTSLKIHVIDPVNASIVSSADLSGSPDYVRFVRPTDELWITEPGSARIEIFAMSKDVPPQLTSSGFIMVDNGPESLVIDAARGRAFTHRWQASTVSIDVNSREIIGDWPNGCAASRGIEVDATTGFVFAVCNEGTASVLNPADNGKILSSIAKGAGYDVIGFNPTLRHLYLAGGACSCLTTLGVSSNGQLTFLRRADAPSDTHCATTDDDGNAWVCEPSNGTIIRLHDYNRATP